MTQERKRPAWADWIGRLGLLFALISGIAMLLMMLVGALDIIGTNLLARPVPAAFEFISSMMVVVVFCALSLAQARKAHLRVEIFHYRMPRRLRRAADVFQYALTTLFFGLIAYYGWLSALLSHAQGEFASGIANYPVWPTRFVLALGTSLMTAQCAVDLIGSVLGWDVDQGSDTRIGAES
ncbi:MAG: hypothetical protein Kow0058_12490 [Roseovarius sp.]